MKQTFLNSIKRIKGFFANTFCKKLPNAVQAIEQYIQHINNLSQHTKSELTTLINELKELPKQREDQLSDRIKALHYLPCQTRKELSTFVKHLSIFPIPIANELSDLVEQTLYLSVRM